MIPIRLEMRNFLPYRVHDPLKFEGIHLACLTGSNGAGKSSILDAITWALWGSARAKRDEDLIHQGQDDMHVQLDFEQEGILYRIIRRRSRNKRSSTGALDLFVRNSEGQFHTINEPTMRATQDKINLLLRLDYETFVHSAFLQQGKADAFTTQQPSKRKQILADILGLEQWSKFEERVKEHLKQLEQKIAFCEERVREINTELARKPALEAEKAEAKHLYAEAEKARDQAQALLDAIKDAPNNLKNRQENKNECERRRRDNQRDLDGVIEQIARHQKQIEDYSSILNMREEIEGGYTALQNARDTDQSLNAKLTDLMNLDKRRADLNSQLSAARARLESECESLEKTISELQTMIAAQPADNLEAAQAEVLALQTLEVERDEITRMENALREEKAGISSLLNSIELQGKEKKDRVQALKDAPDTATCPLCGQPLSAEHREQLVAQLGEEVDAHREDYRTRKERIKAIDSEIKEYKTQLTTVEGQLKVLPSLLENVGKLQAQVNAADQAAARIEEEQARLLSVTAELTEETYAPDVRAALALLDTEQEGLGYDKSAHDATRKTLDEFRRFEQLKMQLSIAQQSLPAIEEALAGSKIRQERLNELIGEIDETVEKLDIEIAGLQVQVAEYNLREQEVRKRHTELLNAHGRLNRAEQALEAIEIQVQRKAKYEKDRETFRHEEGVYKELKTAFGKNGIPAMIIETAIPELELTANDLLSRMTDGRMNLRLTTQKEKVTGGTAETLDIEIADELGTRHYEMYSGGEAFRINFAIRIALSQLLARRAGAHLRTLFIDEGFGTQDDSGRNKLVEAITAIQDDFDMVLVITHIDDLRDSFPVHVVVEKTGSGSRVSVR
jgi:DNA repair protein SbcC/Rad50